MPPRQADTELAGMQLRAGSLDQPTVESIRAHLVANALRRHQPNVGVDIRAQSIMSAY